jgi:hypothetical protein
MPTTNTAQNLDRELGLILNQIDDRRSDRHILQPRLHRVLLDMAAAGLPVPQRLHMLNRDLFEESVEAQFENMPV